jgi:hypothetical protein
VPFKTRAGTWRSYRYFDALDLTLLVARKDTAEGDACALRALLDRPP